MADIHERKMTMIRFHIPDMHCGGCVRRIAKGIQGVGPAAKVEAGLPSGEVHVDGSAVTAALISALADSVYLRRSGLLLGPPMRVLRRRRTIRGTEGATPRRGGPAPRLRHP